MSLDKIEMELMKFTLIRPKDKYDRKTQLFSWEDMIDFAEFYLEQLEKEKS